MAINYAALSSLIQSSARAHNYKLMNIIRLLSEYNAHLQSAPDHYTINYLQPTRESELLPIKV